MIFASVLFLILLLACSAFFSSSETALFSLSPMRVRLFAKDHKTRRRLVAKLLKKPRDLLVTILMLNIAVNIGVQNVISNIFGTFSSWWFTVGVPLLLTLFLGEAIPKSIAISRNAQIATRAAPILYAVRILFGPVRVFLTAAAERVSRFCFFFLKREKEISLNELKYALQTSKERGIVSQDEALLISGSLKIDDLLVKELMRPRQEVLCYDLREPLSRIIQLFVDEEVTRIPVTEGEIDQMIGIMSSDRYFLHRNEIKVPGDLKQFVKEPLFVPETLSARNLLAMFQELKESIAIVVDEYGQISGLISKEDIVEVVIGQIEDKRDVQPMFTKQGDDVIICSGKLEISELEEIFDVVLESESSVVTIGGWLTEKMGDIPKSGAKYVVDDLLFHVLSASPSRVQRVYIRKIKPVKRKNV